MFEIVLVILIASSLVFGFFCSYLANQKGRDGTAWFWLGFFFSFVALIAIASTPSKLSQMTTLVQPNEVPSADKTKVCPYCAETIMHAATICRYCQKTLPESPAATAGLSGLDKEEVMKTHGITYSSLRYHVGEQRFMELDDAIAAALKSEKQK